MGIVSLLSGLSHHLFLSHIAMSISMSCPWQIVSTWVRVFCGARFPVEAFKMLLQNQKHFQISCWILRAWHDHFGKRRSNLINDKFFYCVAYSYSAHGKLDDARSIWYVWEPNVLCKASCYSCWNGLESVSVIGPGRGGTFNYLTNFNET